MKFVIVDYRIDFIEKENLIKLGYVPLFCPKCPVLYNAIDGHPDIQVNFIDKDTLIVHKNMASEFINLLRNHNLNIILSKKELTSKYPGNIILNAVNLSDYFIHKLENTDTELLSLVNDKTLIDVKQGYSKCSTAIVTDRAIITSDPSIAKTLDKYNFDILFLPPGNIELPGLDYGFIGGTCGLLEKNLLAFYGDLDFYPYRNEILSFLKKHKVEPFFLRKGKLIDRGSILRFINFKE